MSAGPAWRRPYRVAVAQMRSGADPYANLAHVDLAVHAAADQGAQLVCFPENVFYRGPRESVHGSRESSFLDLDPRGQVRARTDFARALRHAHGRWPVAVSLGSVLEKSAGAALPFNSHWLLGARGAAVRSYRKIHLFDFAGENSAYRESRDVSAGRNPVVAALARGPRTGLSICYDLRFSELYRELALARGAQLLLVPAAFTRETGRAHWHTLLRARAIENLSFVVAAAQWGSHQNSRGQALHCFGHSVVYAPWGERLAESPGRGDDLLLVDLDPAQLASCRAKLPALSGARLLR